MITGKPVDISPPTHVSLPPEPPPSKGGRVAWGRMLLAPLLALSVVAHLALLFMPLPSRSVAEVKEETAGEEFVDLLSISSLPAAEPEPELPPPLEQPLPESAPPPASQATVPPAPTQPVMAEVSPDMPPPETATVNSVAATENFDPAPEQPVAVVQEAEVIEIFTSLTRGAGDSDFDSTETSFPAIAYLTRGGIGGWSPAEQGCFFEQIDADNYRLRPQAVSLRYLTRNEQFIRNEDVPRTFQATQYQVSDLPGGFCNRTLFQVLRNGQPFLFVSVVGIGVGAPGQQGSGLVIIWSQDPRSI
jgi:hypothetical protein